MWVCGCWKAGGSVPTATARSLGGARRGRGGCGSFALGGTLAVARPPPSIHPPAPAPSLKATLGRPGAGTGHSCHLLQHHPCLLGSWAGGRWIPDLQRMNQKAQAGEVSNRAHLGPLPLKGIMKILKQVVSIYETRVELHGALPRGVPCGPSLGSWAFGPHGLVSFALKTTESATPARLLPGELRSGVSGPGRGSPPSSVPYPLDWKQTRPLSALPGGMPSACHRANPRGCKSTLLGEKHRSLRLQIPRCDVLEPPSVHVY